ncbi:multidrug transporter [Herbiconiux daphne]|uniref:Multidrug transporter n=1 Tax=Herbiconiux daphne TaxID=2970914 RepID=A0ABT2GWJ2_9MICO|nr:multidrug transporter [Herbiconiux daphne]MCS5732334.1 multidrug transporter [Herbiconiux daphne]
MTVSDDRELSDEPDAAEKRHDQLTSAPKSTEADAAPRIDVSVTADGTKRIDWRDDAQFRPGKGPDENDDDD